MAAGELPTAEAAYAAIDAVDKLQFVLHLRGKAAGGTGGGAAGDVVVAAELALARRQPDEAEAMLLQVGCDRLHHTRHASMYDEWLLLPVTAMYARAVLGYT